MHISITARHLKLTAGLADYINRKVERLQKYLNTLVNAQVKLDVEKYRHTTEIILHSGGNIFKAKQTGPDMYATVDLVIDKLESQLRKHKEKLKSKHIPSVRTLATSIYPKMPELNYEFYSESVKALSISQAVSVFLSSNRKFMLFLNPNTGKINLIYKKENGNPAIIEPVL
ncbi:MAG: ribosome-associated translation inhibitor RaiA [Elusimicrobiota bacterium]